MNVGYAVRVGSDGRVLGARRVDGPESIDPATEYFLPLSEGPPPEPLPDDSAVLAGATQQLKVLQAAATNQVNAIKERIEVLTFAQKSGDIQPDEVKEFASATVSLDLWQTYRVELGRVKTSAGWPISPVLPVAPAALSSDAIS